MVRVSGSAAQETVARLLRTETPFPHARARFFAIPDPTVGPAGQENSGLGAGPRRVVPASNSLLGGTVATAVAPLDEAIVTAFHAPRSYTGEDVVEIAAHGSPVVLHAILSECLRLGARLAEPGEFTERAFLAGRLDLTQAEAVGDLIAARTLEQARSAAQQLGGALSRRVAPAKERLLHLLALLEAGMDFASGELDDVDVVSPDQIAAAIPAVESPLQALAASFGRGQMLRSGASLALIGRPNAGKSSLFNRLLERERAIVTPLPGTTRDTVEEQFSLGGLPLRLIDTAGLRLSGDEPADEAERQGIARSREALADADLVLLVHDATTESGAEERELASALADRPHLLIRNKTDLIRPGGDLHKEVSQPLDTSMEATASLATGEPFGEPAGAAEGAVMLATSALTGEGIDRLRAVILEQLNAGGVAEEGALNTVRQQQAVAEALAALQAATLANAAGHPHEVVLLDLHGALRALDTLTGATTTEDILGRIFSTFCIGK